VASITTTSFVNMSELGDIVVVKRNSAPKPPAIPVTRNEFSVLSSREVGLKKFVFRDISPTFTFHPITGDVAYVTDFAAVSQSIRNIVMTERNERHFSQLGFGVGLERYLFQPLSRELEANLQDEIISQVTAYEPRAIIYGVEVVGYPESHALEIRIKFGVRTQTATEVINIFIERA